MLPLLPVERQSLLVQDHAFWSVYCSHDLYEGYKAHSLPISKDGYSKISLYLDDALVLANSYTKTKEDGQRATQLIQKLGFVLSPEKCQLEPTQEFTHFGLVFNIQNMTLSLPPDKVLAIKAWAAKMASPTYRGVMRLLGLMYFDNMALSLARLHFHPLQYWLKENDRTPVNLFKRLKPNQEAAQALL